MADSTVTPPVASEAVATAPVTDSTPGYSAPAYAAAYTAMPAAASSTLSVLALVFGIMGLVFSFFLLGLIPAIAGVILGHLALKREPHARGMAVAGLVTGYVGVGISVLWALAIIVPALVILLASLGLSAAAIGG